MTLILGAVVLDTVVERYSDQRNDENGNTYEVENQEIAKGCAVLGSFAVCDGNGCVICFGAGDRGCCTRSGRGYQRGAT